MEQVDFAGALSWYSRPYVTALLWSPTWKIKQNNWINGYNFYFDYPSSLNTLKGWDYWTESRGFSDIVLYVIMCAIFEQQQSLTPFQHKYFSAQYEEAQKPMNSITRKQFLEEIIYALSTGFLMMDVPDTLNALSYAYENYLIREGYDLTQSQSESSTRTPTGTGTGTGTRIPTGLSDKEKKEIQDQIEKDRFKRKYGKIKGQRQSKLSAQNAIVYGSSIALLIFVTSIVISRRRK